MIGRTISHYKILEELGRGGMGVVYKALDTKLDRTVALKFLPPALAADADAKQRFVHEARAASALDHQNICTIYEINEADEQTFIAMAYVEGHTLKEEIASGSLRLDKAVHIAVQVAEGLREAHEKNIVHRDIKPANIMITPRGQAKIMDFGLAKSQADPGLTKTGTTLGTVAYMSPEQARGDKVDERTDLWSLGVVLYEMLTGQRPFKGDYEQAVLYSILNSEPEAPSAIRQDLSPELDQIVLRALARDPDGRFRSVPEFGKALREHVPGTEMAKEAGTFARRWKSPRVVIPMVVILSAFALLAVRFAQRSREVRWARQEALPAIADLVEREEYGSAYRLALEAREVIPTDPLLDRLWSKMTNRLSIFTSPPGADIYIKEYREPDSTWLCLGRTPLDNLPVPDGFYRYRIEKAGYEPIARAGWSDEDTLEFTLSEIGAIPEGMVRVPGGSKSIWIGSFSRYTTALLPDFFIDRFEVTNRQYQAFVDSGGYQREEFWRHDVVRNDRPLIWEEAMHLFRDDTGRPGPATWELGTFREGSADEPVSGVSWYEAAAYAEFVGKSLPPLDYWVACASISASEYIIPLSNFGTGGLDPVGTHAGLGYYGTYDMAGNAREWCFSASGDERYILGGSWGDPEYMFNFPATRAPLDRSSKNGFRCVLWQADDSTLAVARREVVVPPNRDYRLEEPVPHEVFRAYLSLYHYDRTPLDSRIELVDNDLEHWRIEKVSYDAAYGNERMFAYLFLPRGTSPPYQTVVLFPGAYALQMESSKNGRAINSFDFVDFVIRSGRCALCPVYKSTYERKDGYRIYDEETTSSDHRAHMLMWWKDLSRSIDYLETRNDIDHEKIAYLGSSWGGWMAPLFLAQDGRYRTAVIRLAGFPTWRMNPAFDLVNFAPRVTIPVLMLNGKYDHIFPYETSQLPMFENLGTSPEHKRLVLFETGHSVYGVRNQMIRESLDWLDRYLGPVE